MKNCLRKKCQKEFEPNKPKQVFCSAKCRVYFSREEKPIEIKKVEVKNFNTTTNKVEPEKPLGNGKSNYTIDTTKDEKSKMPDPKDKVAYLKWLRGQ